MSLGLHRYATCPVETGASSVRNTGSEPRPRPDEEERWVYDRVSKARGEDPPEPSEHRCVTDSRLEKIGRQVRWEGEGPEPSEEELMETVVEEIHASRHQEQA